MNNYDTFWKIELICAFGMIFFCIMASCTACSPGLKRFGYVFLGGFTLCMSGLLMGVCAYYDSKVVIIAVAITAAFVIGVTIYSLRTTIDFTFLGAMLWGLCICFLLSLIFSIFAFVMPHKFLRWWYILICFLGVCLFGIYIIIDTQLIMGKCGIQFGVDDYVLAALNIYIDIVYLFIYILRIIGAAKGN